MTFKLCDTVLLYVRPNLRSPPPSVTHAIVCLNIAMFSAGSDDRLDPVNGPCLCNMTLLTQLLTEPTSDIVVQALAYGLHAAQSSTFVLDMGCIA